MFEISIRVANPWLISIRPQNKFIPSLSILKSRITTTILLLFTSNALPIRGHESTNFTPHLHFIRILNPKPRLLVRGISCFTNNVRCYCWKNSNKIQNAVTEIAWYNSIVIWCVLQFFDRRARMMYMYLFQWCIGWLWISSFFFAFSHGHGLLLLPSYPLFDHLHSKLHSKFITPWTFVWPGSCVVLCDFWLWSHLRFSWYCSTYCV